MPLGERKCNNNQSLKRRGGAIASLLLSSPARDPGKTTTKGNGRKPREEDLENQDPNVVLCNANTTLGSKIAKEAIKSSAEKKVMATENEAQVETESKKPAPRLKSTLSARNLFSGRDILGQISEFCNEIKKIAVGREKSSAEERKALVDQNCSKGDDENKLPVLKEVRACPPTPQRFPSPSSRRLRSNKATTSSPLNNNKPPKSERGGVLQEMDQSRKENRGVAASVAVESESEGSSSSSSSSSSMDMFWLFKPCTQMV